MQLSSNVKSASVLFISLALIMLLRYLYKVDGHEKDSFDANVKSFVINDIKQREWKVDTNIRMSPTLVFSGTTSEIISVSTFNNGSIGLAGLLLNTQWVEDVLIKTQQNRYSMVRYRYIWRRLSACNENPSNCLYNVTARVLSADEAMDHVFRHTDISADKYQMIFGTAMPPRSIPG